jgi:pyruvate,water dikinase
MSVVWLDGPTQPRSQVGGKAANLMTLLAAGFPVPAGFVVTVSAYEDFVASIDGLADDVAALDRTEVSELADRAARLRERMSLAALPEAALCAIKVAYARIGGAAVAVRSSSTLEDLAQAAFAGQHDTFLDVHGLAALGARVRDCYTSLWAERAVRYRRERGFAQRQARMAVVVQLQVACDAAGVAFSVEPVAGRMDRVVVEANWGLGESVVSGEGEVDHFELDKATLEPALRRLGRKTRKLTATGRGMQERVVPEADASAACLSDTALAQVAALALRAERHFGWPQDIEWGLAGGRLHMFQSRAVTAIAPRWTRDESAERFPRPMSPLTWDFISLAFQRSLAHSLAIMGLPAFTQTWFARKGDHIYGDQNAVALLAAFRPLRGRTLDEIASEIPDLPRRYAWVSELPVAWASGLDRYLVGLGRLSAVDLERLEAAELWAQMLAIFELASDYFRPNIAISMTQALLVRVLHGFVGLAVGREKALAAVDGLLAGCATKTSLVNRELRELARLLAARSALAERLLTDGGRGFWSAARRHDEANAFFPHFDRFLADHGHRELDMDYLVPTWSEQPWIVLDMIALLLRSGSPEPPSELELRQRSVETEQQILAALPVKLQFFFRELVRLARAYTELDDLEHYQTTRVNPAARRVVVALGRRLQTWGILDAPEDAFFFTRRDLEACIRSGPTDASRFRQSVYEAKRSYTTSSERTPPWALDATTSAPESQVADGVLRGLPGSPGRASGPCWVIEDSADFARFPTGAVLVARTTSPAWTPLFFSACAVVTESGGPLSHGAVTAREVRVPAVMSVRGATVLLRGARVSVDGSSGTVTIEDR